MTFLFCGLGSIGKRHLRILKELGNFKYIAFRSGKSVKNEKAEVDIEINSLNEITKHKIDAALITNPTSLHIETAIEVAKHGIPMFIEKPLDKNLNKISEFKSLTSKKSIPVLLGYNLIHHPAILKIKELVQGKVTGEVISARAQFGTYMPGWHKDENYKKSYAANSELGGGVVLTSIHEQNYLTDLFGKVTEVKAMEAGGSVLGINAEEGIEILMKHTSGVVSNVHLNFFQKPYYRNLQIIGTEGTIYWDFMKPEIKIMKQEGKEIITLGRNAIELLDISYSNQMKHFLDVISRKAKPVMNLENGIEDLAVAEKILEETGK